MISILQQDFGRIKTDILASRGLSFQAHINSLFDSCEDGILSPPYATHNNQGVDTERVKKCQGFL